MEARRSQISALTMISIIVIVFSLIHLGVEAQVDCKVTRNGGNATLTCKIPSHMDFVQVTWQKRTGNSYDTMATHSKRFGVKISKSYENRLNVLPTKDPKTSSIIISQLEKEDDACFICIFTTYPEGSLKEEIPCLTKLCEVKEVICKSTADTRVTLTPEQIKTQHADPSGTTIQMGRWLNDDISPVCNFQLQEEARKKRFQDNDEIFTIQCNASGRQKAKITWTEEGQPISKEEKVNITGDLINVTSTQRHSLATLPKGKGISCNISYNHDDGITSAQDNDLCHKKNLEAIIITIISSIILCVIIGAVCYFFKNRKKPHSQKKRQRKNDKVEDGPLSAPNSSDSDGPVFRMFRPPSGHHEDLHKLMDNAETSRNKVKRRTGSSGKKRKGKNQRKI